METPAECITQSQIPTPPSPSQMETEVPTGMDPQHSRASLTEPFENWTKEELVDRVKKLTIHVKQLRNVIQKSGPSASVVPYTKRRKEARAFDFSAHSKRHVLLKFAYLGWDFHGYAAQEDSDHTIEAHLFSALTRTKLIESRETSNYHRCGRTDKGVSAFTQVISIDLRSKSAEDKESEELNYPKILNRVLPPEIKILAWAPVDEGFSARFDCVQRTYRYYFPVADLDFNKMKTACQFLIGTHDFRNFCKINPNGDPTIRRIINVDFEVSTSTDMFYSIGKLIIKGQSFVWHQIRCIVAILILVGKGLEEPDIVQKLLDLENGFPLKPQYSMVVPEPLVLYDVAYTDNLLWTYDIENVDYVISELQKLWVQHKIKSSMVYDMMRDVEIQKEKLQLNSGPSSLIKEHLDCLIMGSKSKIYKKLSDRPTCDRN